MYIQYIKYIALTVALFLLSIFLINYFIDPLSYIRANTSYTYFSTERNLKPKMLEVKQYDGLIMGSSKVAYIHPEDINIDDKILNASFSGALPEEILMFLQEEKPKVKWIAIGFDWYMFNEDIKPYEVNGTFQKSNTDILKYLMSFDAIRYSIISIIKKIYNELPKYAKGGNRISKHQEKKDSQKTIYSDESILAELSDKHINTFKVSELRLQDIVKIQRWASNNNIFLVGWVNPYSKDVLELMQKKLDKETLLLPKKLSTRVSNFIDLSASYQDRNLYWNSDPIHYYPSFGGVFFNKHIIPMINSNFESR